MPATARLEARTTPETLALLKRAAEIEGRSLTDFVVAAASAAARQTLDVQEVMRLNLDSSHFLLGLLEEPLVDPKGVSDAFSAHDALIRTE
jgi:uncharacterized protein (DUF1778 family)